MSKTRTPAEKKMIDQAAKAVNIAAEQTLQQTLSEQGVTIHRTECRVILASSAKAKKKP